MMFHLSMEEISIKLTKGIEPIKYVLLLLCAKEAWILLRNSSKKYILQRFSYEFWKNLEECIRIYKGVTMFKSKIMRIVLGTQDKRR